MLDKLEKIGLINSAQEWIKIRKLRNKIAHEYPEEIEETVKDIKEALKYTQEMSSTLEKIEYYLKERGML